MIEYNPENVGIVLSAYHNSPHCGDQCGVWLHEGKTVACIVDGLGHGLGAEEAAKAAIDYVSCHLQDSLPDLFTGCNTAIRESRGVAMAVAIIHHDKGNMTYSCIGNTRAVIIESNTRHISGDPGIVGGGFRNLLVESYSFNKGATVVWWSDGLDEFINFSRYRRHIRDSAQNLAERIINDFNKGDDDASVMVVNDR
jgi:serine/threonine protein phosphatase PrpC